MCLFCDTMLIYMILKGFKNKDFFHLQYDKINWKNQDKTKINQKINEKIIEYIFSVHRERNISLFDIGFGIGFFVREFVRKGKDVYRSIYVEGCEPSKKNFYFFEKKYLERLKKYADVQVSQETFQHVHTKQTFDFVTATYVFPHFLSEDLESVVDNIKNILKMGGKFILVLADEEYLKEKLSQERDLFIEKSEVEHNGKVYYEILHYSDIPKIGKVIDYNREEKFYIDLFESKGFSLEKKEKVNDSGFVGVFFVFANISS
jgi:SAM-dependent methyltransferase